MRIHRIGRPIVLTSLIICLSLAIAFIQLLPIAGWILAFGLLVLFLFILQFFRNPHREIPIPDPNAIYTPADGKVVVIEETFESEFFKDRRLLISIFMSPLNVHLNRVPIDGQIVHKQHFSGTFLPAWNPKSSIQNERLTTVIAQGDKGLLIRQIAGAMARRILHFRSLGEEVKQGEELGFIRFGSRVDVFLPIGSHIQVEIGQMVKGNLDILAFWEKTTTD